MSKLKATANNTFFTSDTHFGHKNVIKHCNRPYSNIEEMQEDIIRIWNKTVPETAVVFHLGDFSFLPPEKLEWVLPRLNGDIILVRGNHDPDTTVALFQKVYDLVDLSILDNGTKYHIVLCHYPLAVWNKRHHGAYHLHGHSHGSYVVPKGKILDVGWDVWQKPISFKEVVEYMDKREPSDSTYAKEV